jgi:hypothetical protein
MELISARKLLHDSRRFIAISGAMVILAAISACQTAGKRTHPGTHEAEPCKPRTVTEKAAASPATTDAYDKQVLSLDPVLYLTFPTSSSTETDLSGNGNAAVFLPADEAAIKVAMPNGDMAAEFNGLDQYVQVPSSNTLSLTDTGCMTVEAWLRPATLQFPHEEGTGYVYILGKGAPGKYEYAIRMYSETNTEDPVRPNRISGYVFNLVGGLGSGAYFQDKVEVGQWIMVTLVMDEKASARWPDGYIALYKDGGLEDQVSMKQYDVTPHAGNAPFCIGTRDTDSYFEGAIGKVAVYDRILTSSQIAATYNAMFSN